MSIKRETLTAAALLGLGACLSSTTTLADEIEVFGSRSDRLELSAYLDEPGGSEIADGRFAEAVTEIESRMPALDTVERIVAYNNLCVARTMLSEFLEAEYACDVAVRRATGYDKQIGFHRSSSAAKALSNRGVLHVLLGDLDEAFADLEKADARNREGLTAPSRNLAYIGAVASASVAEIDRR